VFALANPDPGKFPTKKRFAAREDVIIATAEAIIPIR